jgi:hypothetical protein
MDKQKNYKIQALTHETGKTPPLTFSFENCATFIVQRGLMLRAKSCGQLAITPSTALKVRQLL